MNAGGPVMQCLLCDPAPKTLLIETVKLGVAGVADPLFSLQICEVSLGLSLLSCILLLQKYLWHFPDTGAGFLSQLSLKV